MPHTCTLTPCLTEQFLPSDFMGREAILAAIRARGVDGAQLMDGFSDALMKEVGSVSLRTSFNPSPASLPQKSNVKSYTTQWSFHPPCQQCRPIIRLLATVHGHLASFSNPTPGSSIVLSKADFDVSCFRIKAFGKRKKIEVALVALRAKQTAAAEDDDVMIVDETPDGAGPAVDPAVVAAMLAPSSLGSSLEKEKACVAATANVAKNIGDALKARQATGWASEMIHSMRLRELNGLAEKCCLPTYSVVTVGNTGAGSHPQPITSPSPSQPPQNPTPTLVRSRYCCIVGSQPQSHLGALFRQVHAA